MSDREDLRIVKTRRSIETAFMELLKERSFEQITVRQLIENALISKGTFYAHYLDKYDLAEKIAYATLQEFRLGIQERMAATIEGSDLKVIMASLRRTLTTTIPRLNLLKKVRTENLDVDREMRAIITGEYLDFQKKEAPISSIQTCGHTSLLRLFLVSLSGRGHTPLKTHWTSM